MSKVGIAAVRSLGTEANKIGTTPTPTLNQNALTGNLMLACVGSDDTTTSPPAGWTELVDQSQPTPLICIEVCTLASGFTGTAITFGAATTTLFASIGIEVDGSNDGTAAITLAGVTLVATGQLTSHGVLAVTLDGVTVSSAGAIADQPWTGGGVNGPGTTIANPVMPGRVWHF
jgi:hypothetical protein